MQLSINRGTDTQNVVHPHREYYSVLKREEILTSPTTQMNLEDAVPSERSQSRQDKYCTRSLEEPDS